MSEVLLSSLYEGVATGKVKAGELEIGFHYNPNIITVEKAQQLADGNVELTDMLAEVLIDWEVVMVEGEPFPPTAENIAKLPVTLMRKIMRIVRDNTGEFDDEGNDDTEDGSFASG